MLIHGAIQEFKFDVGHIPGQNNMAADALIGQDEQDTIRVTPKNAQGSDARR